MKSFKYVYYVFLFSCWGYVLEIEVLDKVGICLNIEDVNNGYWFLVRNSRCLSFNCLIKFRVSY